MRRLTVMLMALLFSGTASAILIFEGGRVELSLDPDGAPPSVISDFSVSPVGAMSLSDPAYGMFNTLSWSFDEPGAVVVSSMLSSGGGSIVHTEATWYFTIEDGPVQYWIDASTDLVNTRFFGYVPGTMIHECLSPGCDSDWLWAGSHTGMIEPGYRYVLELQPGVDDFSLFTFRVPEPGTLGLLGAGVLALGLAGVRRRRAI